MSVETSDLATEPLQPLLHDEVVALRAPTQYVAAPTGEVGTQPIHGVYHGDLRHIREISLTYDGFRPEPIALNRISSSRLEGVSLLRAIDDAGADPKVRLIREIEVHDGKIVEFITVESQLDTEIHTQLAVRVVPDFAPMQEIKSGHATSRTWSSDPIGSQTQIRPESGEGSLTISSPDGHIITDDAALVLHFPLSIAPRGRVRVCWEIGMEDPTLVVRGVTGEQRWEIPDTTTADRTDFRIARWLDVALDDLDGLRLALPDAPQDEFFAAGAPWFFTLFGRDSIWAARLTLALRPAQAKSTLKVLARLQSTEFDVRMAAAPGKIMHELRSAPLAIPGEKMVLPPIYYGTVDATPLWVCLLADTYAAGAISPAEVEELLPNLRAALTWITEHGDSDGDGFLDYIDETGQGLANQGWKDSGDAIQWRTGELAQGPLALCEVQGYAYEAAIAGANLLNEFGADNGESDVLHAWAENLKTRFAQNFWVTTPEGTYPAIALDANKNPVNSLTSNIGHLIGTGILSHAEEIQIADLLVGETMLSGYGIRTLSSEAAGYWPLSYHGGSVWAHDTAIIVWGMLKAGMREPAVKIARNLLDLAEGFNYRVPELHSGDTRDHSTRPVPYPAACRPQAWSAAASVVCLEALNSPEGRSDGRC